VPCFPWAIPEQINDRPVQLDTVIHNLVANAREAMPQVGKADHDHANQRIREGEYSRPSNPNSPGWRIGSSRGIRKPDVEDTGIG